MYYIVRQIHIVSILNRLITIFNEFEFWRGKHRRDLKKMFRSVLIWKSILASLREFTGNVCWTFDHKIGSKTGIFSNKLRQVWEADIINLQSFGKFQSDGTVCVTVFNGSSSRAFRFLREFDSISRWRFPPPSFRIAVEADFLSFLNTTFTRNNITNFGFCRFN